MTLTGSYTAQSDAEWQWSVPDADTDTVRKSAAEPDAPVAQEHVASLLEALPGLKRFAKALTGSMAEADDLVQMAVERALRQPQLLDSVGNLGSWMRRVMRNGWLDDRKSARNRYAASEAASEDIVGEDGEDTIAVRSQLRAVQKAMAELPPDLREALVLVTIEGMSYRDAADRLGVPVACLNSRIARARAVLAETAGLLPAKGTKAR